MPGNVYWFDKQGIAVGCNKNVLTLFGLNSQDEFKNLSFEDMAILGNWSPVATSSFKNDTLEVIATGKAKLNIEEPAIPHNSGDLIWFLTSRVPLFDHSGAIAGIVGISIDITERKQMEQELKNAKEQADLANKLKTEFISNMEHDMRTPLSGVLGLATLFSEIELDVIKKTVWADIANCSKELLGYCNCILDFSKIQSGSLPILKKRISIKPFIDGILAMELPPAKLKKLPLLLDYEQNIPAVVIGDHHRLQRILINLVSNAIKFTEIGYVKLIARLVHQDEKSVVLRFIIEDTGIGIPKAKQSLVYERFFRIVQSDKNNHKGMGLGLPIVKQFMKEINGEISLTSKTNKGTSFSCTIPFKLPLTNETSGE